MVNPNEEEKAAILDWEDLSDLDQARASELLRELNQIFDKYYYPKKDEETNDNSS